MALRPIPLEKTLTAAATMLLGGVALMTKIRSDSFSNQVAIVTGGSRGLGLILAEELARKDCRVAICARDEDELAKAKAQIEAYSPGAAVLSVVCDVTSQADAERLVAAVRARWGHVDILVNNAGIIQVAPVENFTLDDFKQAMDVNFYGALHMVLAVLPEMLARESGRIINVTSFGGLVPVPHLLPYCASKFAEVGLSEGLAVELKGRNVHVTTAVPGLMRTGSYVNAMFKGQTAKEYGWFATSAKTPVVAINARRAARRILGASRRREMIRFVGWPAVLGAKAHGIFPEVVERLISVVSAVFPKAEIMAGEAPKPGSEVAEMPRREAQSAPAGAQRPAS